VTLVAASLRTGMRGRRHRRRNDGALAFRLPDSCFSQEPDQRFRARQPSRFAWSWHFELTFRSPAAVFRFRFAATGSTLPASIFRAVSEVETKPVRSAAPLLYPVGPGLGRILRDKPVAQFRSRTSGGARISTPLRGFYSPYGSQRSILESRRKAHLFEIRPISLRSPQAIAFVNRLRIIVPGSLHLTRLDCSVNLLEP